MDLTIKKIPIPKANFHPKSPSDVLPRHEFTMGIISPKGSGKTTLMCNIIKFYKNYFHSIIIVSPSVKEDDKWDYIRKLPLLVENKPLKEFLKANGQGLNQNNSSEIVQPATVFKTPTNDKKEKEFSPYIPEENFMDTITLEQLNDLMHEQATLIEFLVAHGKSKYLANRVLFILDDMVGSELFSGKKTSSFKTFNANHRHHSFSALMVTQGYNEIPRMVRTNFSCIVLFDVPNEKELEIIYRENPCGLKFEQWKEVHQHCTSAAYNFMFINYQQERALRIMHNFDKFMIIK